MNDYVQCEIQNSVALVTINRPEALNALNADVLQSLFDKMNELDKNSGVKVIILTGAGNKAFVAGADISSMVTMNPEEGMVFAQLGQRTMNRIASMRPVTIAAINGYALGGGCELAMACDIRIASTKARMGIPEVTLGVFPGFGGTQRLPRLVGLGIAQELLATGRQCKAEECKEIGLVNHLAAPEDLMNCCLEMAGEICKNSTGAIALGKQCMSSGMEMDIERGLELEAGLFAVTFSTADQTEGMGAFLEKRKAQFQ